MQKSPADCFIILCTLFVPFHRLLLVILSFWSFWSSSNLRPLVKHKQCVFPGVCRPPPTPLPHKTSNALEGGVTAQSQHRLPLTARWRSRTVSAETLCTVKLIARWDQLRRCTVHHPYLNVWLWSWTWWCCHDIWKIKYMVFKCGRWLFCGDRSIHFWSWWHPKRTTRKASLKRTLLSTSWSTASKTMTQVSFCLPFNSLLIRGQLVARWVRPRCLRPEGHSWVPQQGSRSRDTGWHSTQQPTTWEEDVVGEKVQMAMRITFRVEMRRWPWSRRTPPSSLLSEPDAMKMEQVRILLLQSTPPSCFPKVPAVKYLSVSHRVPTTFRPLSQECLSSKYKLQCPFILVLESALQIHTDSAIFSY